MKARASGRWLARLVALAVLALPSACTLHGGAPEHVLLITLDTTRADRIGCFGDRRAHTPTLDSLAAHGIRFSEASTPVPLTAPAHSSILTAKNPCRHGVRDNGLFVLDASLPHLAVRFRTAGYQTAAFVSAFVLAREFGLGRGFDVYDDRFYNERSGKRTTAAALRWLERADPKKPVFLWVHYFDAHAPWKPPEPYRSLDLPDGYAKEIAAMDGAIGDLLAGFRRAGLLSRTVILVAGDHGEGLGDHDEDEHGIFLYDETVRVPMILSLPRGPRGREIRQPVSLIDVAPTLLEATSLAPLPEAEGTSLFRLLEGKPWPRRAEYAETFFPEHNYDHAPLRALRTGRWKYVQGPEPELYRLTDDPHETRNLIADLPDTARLFQDRLDRYLASLPALPSGASSLSAEDLERLRSLGYLSGGPPTETAARALPDPKRMRPYLDTFARGKQAFQEHRWADAAQAFEEVLRQNPASRVASLDLGKTLIRLGRHDDAARVLREAWNRSPENATLAKNLGEALRRAGRPTEALEAYRSASADAHQHWSSVLGMTGSLLDLGRLDEARALLTAEAAKESGAEGKTAQELASRLEHQIDRYTALTHRHRQVPADERVRLDLAGAAFDLGLWQLARSALEFSSKDPYIEGSRLRILGSIAGAEDDSREALGCFERARTLLPEDAYVLEHLTSLYLGEERPGDALNAADDALRLGAKNAVLQYNRACAQALLGQTDASIASLERAVQLGYSRASRMLEDPDLAALAADPRFLRLAERATEQSAER